MGRGCRLGRDGAGSVPGLLLRPQPQALGIVSPHHLAARQHLLHQDAREARAGHSREIRDVQPAEVPEGGEKGRRPL